MGVQGTGPNYILPPNEPASPAEVGPTTAASGQASKSDAAVNQIVNETLKPMIDGLQNKDWYNRLGKDIAEAHGKLIANEMKKMMDIANDEANQTIAAGKTQRQRMLQESIRQMVQAGVQKLAVDLIDQFNANFDAEKFKQILEKNKPPT